MLPYETKPEPLKVQITDKLSQDHSEFLTRTNYHKAIRSSYHGQPTAD